MSAILPPAERLWWKHPLDRVEGTWIVISLIWCLIMFAMMVGWHIWGKQNLSTETYRTTPDLFTTKAQAVVDKYTVRTESFKNQAGVDEDIPVVAPPPGSDVYLVARLWNFWPIIELEQDKTYRLHITSMDYNHGLSIQPANINIQIVPGFEHVVKVTPNKAGTYSLACNEYCGIMHHTMVSRLYVKQGATP